MKKNSNIETAIIGYQQTVESALLNDDMRDLVDQPRNIIQAIGLIRAITTADNGSDAKKLLSVQAVAIKAILDLKSSGADLERHTSGYLTTEQVMQRTARITAEGAGSQPFVVTLRTGKTSRSKKRIGIDAVYSGSSGCKTLPDCEGENVWCTEAPAAAGGLRPSRLTQEMRDTMKLKREQLREKHGVGPIHLAKERAAEQKTAKPIVEVEDSNDGFYAMFASGQRPSYVKGCPLGEGSTTAAAVRDLCERTNMESGTDFTHDSLTVVDRTDGAAAVAAAKEIGSDSMRDALNAELVAQGMKQLAKWIALQAGFAGYCRAGGRMTRSQFRHAHTLADGATLRSGLIAWAATDQNGFGSFVISVRGVFRVRDGVRQMRTELILESTRHGQVRIPADVSAKRLYEVAALFAQRHGYTDEVSQRAVGDMVATMRDSNDSADCLREYSAQLGHVVHVDGLSF